MEWQERVQNSLLCLLLVGSVVTPVISRSLQEFSEQKNFYPQKRTLSLSLSLSHIIITLLSVSECAGVIAVQLNR